MNNPSDHLDFQQLREDIQQIPVDQPTLLLEKIKSISDKFAGRDFKIARNLHELQTTIFTGDEQDAANFKDIKNKLLYLLEEMEKL